jgi:hypothetical protein
VIDGVGTVTIDNLPLGIYRVEELANGGYQVILDPEDGIVDLTSAEDNSATVVVVNTPRPELMIEKVLLDTEGVPVENSDVEFTVILDGGLFIEEEFVFSVNEPAVFDYGDGLEFEVLYTVTEVVKEGYSFVSIDPEETFVLTDEESNIKITIVNQLVVIPPTPPTTPAEPTQTLQPPQPPAPPQTVVLSPGQPQVSLPPQVVVVLPDQPQVSPSPQEETPQVPLGVGGADEEDIATLFVDTEAPLVEPEEVLFVAPDAPLATPSTGGAIYVAITSIIMLLFGSGVLLKQKLL